MSKKVAIVILNWNGHKMLESFLPSVVSNSEGCEVVIADNGSTDDSLKFLQEHYPALRVIALDRNYGFAEGYNRALAQVEADYYVLLNDDVEVTPGWVETVFSALEKDPQAAIAQPKLLMYNARDTFEYSGGAGGFIDKMGYPFCRGRMFGTLEKDQGQYDSVEEVFWASGAALFIKSGVWKELGGLDGDFFAHMEEIDLCWRAHNRGYKVLAVPQTTVYHVGGGTLPKSSPRKTFLNFRNNLSMLYKNLPGGRKCWVITIRLALDYVAAMKFLVEGKPQELSAVVKAHWAFYRWLPSLKEKRKTLAPHKVANIYGGNLLIDYYLLKKKKYSQLKWKRQ